MDQMIDKELVKRLRAERSWSQDQLASVSGLSLRTIQRIESDGSCSLDSKKALAAIFEINASNLDLNTAAIDLKIANRRNRHFGFLGAVLGLLFAYAGITYSLVVGHITYGEAGLYYAGVSAFCGSCCAIIGVLSNKLRMAAG